jgi:periplasmic protein CpxP/Spy
MNARKILVAVAAAGVIAGFGADASAQMMGGGSGMGFFSNGIARGTGMFGSPSNMQAVASTWLAALRGEIEISAAQEAAWQSFANAVAMQADAMQSMRTQMLQVGAMSASQRAILAEQFMGRRLDAATAVSQSLATLYAQLSPSQQAILDQEFLSQCGARGLFGS